MGKINVVQQPLFMERPRSKYIKWKILETKNTNHIHVVLKGARRRVSRFAVKPDTLSPFLGPTGGKSWPPHTVRKKPERQRAINKDTWCQVLVSLSIHMNTRTDGQAHIHKFLMTHAHGDFYKSSLPSPIFVNVCRPQLGPLSDSGLLRCVHTSDQPWSVKSTPWFPSRLHRQAVHISFCKAPCCPLLWFEIKFLSS